MSEGQDTAAEQAAGPETAAAEVGPVGEAPVTQQEIDELQAQIDDLNAKLAAGQPAGEINAQIADAQTQLEQGLAANPQLSAPDPAAPPADAATAEAAAAVEAPPASDPSQGSDASSAGSSASGSSDVASASTTGEPVAYTPPQTVTVTVLVDGVSYQGDVAQA